MGGTVFLLSPVNFGGGTGGGGRDGGRDGEERNVLPNARVR